jgi:membrane fusion protein, copper/silver efflux system
MKKVFVMLSIAVFLIAVSCNRGSSDTQKQPAIQESKTQVYYTCPMHPEVHSDQPGKCPICGMELVKNEAAVSDSTDLKVNSDSM